jgi:hypothetical protein
MKATGLVLLLLVAALTPSCRKSPQEIERPETIVSPRQVIYDHSTYTKLAHAWERYYQVYPSEDAYANWMRALGLADSPEFPKLLEKGMEKYPANPKILYLSGQSKLHLNKIEARQLLERAASLDHSFMDPWFALVVSYQANGEPDNANVALRHLLEGGAMQDEVMDFSYNMISCLDSNAILITNGDNDTFSGWMLTRVIGFRPDVTIVDRSLLNTDWYPLSVIKAGVPRFANQSALDSLRKLVNNDAEKARKDPAKWSTVRFLSDRLIMQLIDVTNRAGRPVYFTSTLESERPLEIPKESRRHLGLVTLVSHTDEPYNAEAQKVLARWISTFRTGGLDSWRLRAEDETKAGKMLMRVYGSALLSLQDQIRASRSELQLELFHWYQKHLIDVLPSADVEGINQMWCTLAGPTEIRTWCKGQGLIK